MTHRGRNGSSHSDRIRDQGFEANASAENIAYGYPFPNLVFSAWMRSRGHRRNILADYDFIGVGEYNTYWCVVFANTFDPPVSLFLLPKGNS